MADKKYFRLIGREQNVKKDDRTDEDENPQTKGISAGVLITPSTSKSRPICKGATLSPNPSLITLDEIDARLDDGRLKLFADSVNPAHDQPDVVLTANCSALGLDDDEDLIYTVSFYSVTGITGKRITLPSFSFVAPRIPDDATVETVVDWTIVEWLEQAQMTSGGTLIRRIPDDVQMTDDGYYQFLSGGEPLGDPVAPLTDLDGGSTESYGSVFDANVGDSAVRRIQHRRGTTTEWEAVTYPLLASEIGYDITTHRAVIGDGVTLPDDLSPLATMQDVAEAVLAGGGGGGLTLTLNADGFYEIGVGEDGVTLTLNADGFYEIG